jgi:hypothetical protein
MTTYEWLVECDGCNWTATREQERVANGCLAEDEPARPSATSLSHRSTPVCLSLNSAARRTYGPLIKSCDDTVPTDTQDDLSKGSIAVLGEE